MVPLPDLSRGMLIAKPQIQESVDAVARLVEAREALAIKRLVVSRKK
jgi:hypothetical protein